MHIDSSADALLCDGPTLQLPLYTLWFHERRTSLVLGYSFLFWHASYLYVGIEARLYDAGGSFQMFVANLSSTHRMALLSMLHNFPVTIFLGFSGCFSTCCWPSEIDCFKD